MHPLERQVNDLKEQLAGRDRALSDIRVITKNLGAGIDKVREMLHPTRQKYADGLKKMVEEIGRADVHKR